MYLSSLFCNLISLSLFSIILPSDLLPDVVPQCQGGNGRCLIRVLEAVLTSGGVYHILSTSPDFGPRACSVVSLPACRASLDNSLSLFHASSPFLDCRKLGGASKLLPQVCVTLSCVESILHLSTPQRPKACCEAAHLPRAKAQAFPVRPHRLGEEDSGILKPSWALLGVQHRSPLPLLPHTTLDKLEKDPELFLRSSPVSTPAFLLIFSFHLLVQVNFI